MDNILGELDASMQAKVEADIDFLSTIADLPEEEKTQKIAEKKSELINTELVGLKEGSEKAAKAQELADNYKIRAERAEKKAERDSAIPKGDLSQKDLLYIAKADIHEEDLDSVVDYAKLKKIPVSEAKAYMQPILDKNAEERRTADATHTRGSGRGTSNVSGTDLLAQAERGEEVDLNEGDNAEKIFQARLARKTSKFKRK